MIGYEPDLEPGEARGLAFAREEIPVPGFDPIGEDARRDGNRQHAGPGAVLEVDLTGRPEPGLQLFGVELSVETLEDCVPDLGHCGGPDFHSISTAVEGLCQPGGGSICEVVGD